MNSEMIRLAVAKGRVAKEAVKMLAKHGIVFDEDVDNTFFIEFAKPKTLELIQEIIQSIDE